ncbi:MAG: methylated-DNA--[protein]-cysteine S-methyltransferase [Deltaproteobacteria bacterium]|nr:methylated-DNA--[protein]-cysteine S-methyltransferase [Deltaproteobacteria bacterium]
MPPLSIQCLTFSFKEISGQVICLDDSPVHLTFSPARHATAKQWLEKHLGATCIPGNSTNHHYFPDLLVEFFEGRRQNFPLPVRSPFVEKGTEFQRHVWECIAKIPYGETKTYGELAQTIGNPGAARAVGQACNANPLALIVPCHRVVGSSGLGGFAGGCATKKYLIEMEQLTLMRDIKKPAVATKATASS